MKKSIFEVKDSSKTAWYSSDSIDNIERASAFLSQAIDIKGNPDISTLEQCGGAKLHPISQDEYIATVQMYADGSCTGLVAEIDLTEDNGRFTCVGRYLPDFYRISGMISRITGCYGLAKKQESGIVDVDVFIEELLHHCSWEKFSSPQDCFGTQIPSAAPDQGLTMS